MSTFVVILTPLLAPVGLSAQGAPNPRPATCAEGLKVYRTPSDVPTPHDTVLPDLTNLGNTVNGLRQITDREEFRKALLRRAAAIGATGFINYGTEGSDENGRVSLGRVLPVFVAADSARAHAVCKNSTTSPSATPARARRLQR